MQEKHSMPPDEDVIDVMEFFAFLRANRRRLLLFGAGSLLITLLLCAAVYCLCPRKTIYSTSVTILLDQQNGQYVYPSGRQFSNADLLSQPVLWKVYQDCNLQDTVTFEKFQRSFFISRRDPEIAKVNARFREKFRQKNLTLVDVKQLERDYSEELSLSRTSLVTVSMLPNFPIGRQQAERIINAVPETWFDIYSVVEARPYPQIETSSAMRKLRDEIGKDGQLVLLEKSRQFCHQLIKMCDLLNKMLQGQNIALKSGEFIGDIRARLVSLDRYQLSVLQQYVLTHPEYQAAFDRIFLESCLQNIELDLARVRAKYDGTVDSMSMLTSNRGKIGGGTAAGGANAPLTMQLDNGIFDSLAEMIRNDATNTLRKLYAEKSMDFKEQCADLEADKKRYEQILGILDKKKQEAKNYTTISKEQFNAHMRAMFDDLLALGDKVVMFRDRVIREYLTSRQFYAAKKDVREISDRSLPVLRIVAGILVLWLLLNVCRPIFLFLNREKKENA